MAAPRAIGSPAETNDPEYYADVRRRLSDLESRLEDMDRYGIETMVLSLSQPGVQGIPERARAVDTARRVNDEMAELISAHPSSSGSSPNPYENVQEQSEWFESLPISEIDLHTIGRDNARRLLGMWGGYTQTPCWRGRTMSN